jgi:hypothetical protein
MPLRTVSLDELIIDDEASLAGLPIYPRLKEALRRSGHRFHLPAADQPFSWDRALFLNLTFWNAEAGSDVLCDEHIPADVVTHVAWHRVVGDRLGRAAPGARSAAGMLFGESIASAFDLYLLGRLWRDAPGSDFVTSQVPILSEAAQEAGLSERDFAALMADIAADPARAFEDLRALLFDAATALVACADAPAAQRALEGFAGHRFAPLLHHYQLSNWILYTRAYGTPAPALDRAVLETDATLRQAPVSLTWLETHWLE